MLQRRRGQDKIEAKDAFTIDGIKELEADLAEAERDLSTAERHNSVVEGRIEAANETLAQAGYQDTRSAKRAADQIMKKVEKKVDKLNADLDQFVEDFDVLKEALPGGRG